MDPNATLAELIRIARANLESEEPEAARMAELIEALDTWICNGGFLPHRWERPRNGR